MEYTRKYIVIISLLLFYYYEKDKLKNRMKIIDLTNSINETDAADAYFVSK